ncbi:hypothetical protein ACIPL1_14760 [Pseudomonas sp. NPDC090202]|uniref:hypothetical protein n=1 Tax=unclassified Pseudomonas TaxID=196821 RepID=UPI0037FB7F38
MSQGYHGGCVCSVDRPSNDELSALMARVAVRGEGASDALLVAVAPLLTAFFEGQVQAGRARREDLDSWVREAGGALYRRRSGYDATRPFRAWLLDIAREQLLDYLHSHADIAQSLLADASPACLFEPARAV